MATERKGEHHRQWVGYDGFRVQQKLLGRAEDARVPFAPRDLADLISDF